MQMIQKFLNKPRKYKITLAALLFILLAALLFFGISAGAQLNSPDIYDGVFIGEIPVGGCSTDEAAAAVKEHYADALAETVILRCEEAEQSLSMTELQAEIDVDKTVNVAYQIAREGNIFRRLKQIRSLKREQTVLDPIIRCNDEILSAALQNLAAAVDQPGQDMQLSLGESTLTITKGVPGLCINKEAAVSDFKAHILSQKDGIFSVGREEVLPKKPVASEIHDEICGDPVDARYTVEDRRLVIHEDRPGVSFDVAEAQKLIDQADGDIIAIPVTTTPAALTAAQLKASLFTDLLGSYSSRYNAGDTSRSHNVSLAAQKINEVVLAPGDIFSYNDVVGPRTTARGFKTANVYVGNKVEPGVGGGICQVSSTLFNAVVLSDLKIVSRTNHSLPVSYVPLGRDATVSYGSIDFKFSNNTGSPIKIVASASGGTNYIAIYGVKENKNKTIAITTERVSTQAARLVQKEDPSLPAGTVRVEQKGSDGSTYNTYKLTQENGHTVKTEFLAKSTYVASDRIEVIGTGAVAESETTPAAAVPAEDIASHEANTPEPETAGETDSDSIVISNPAAQ